MSDESHSIEQSALNELLDRRASSERGASQDDFYSMPVPLGTCRWCGQVTNDLSNICSLCWQVETYRPSDYEQAV
jgi:hypothetical protein